MPNTQKWTEVIVVERQRTESVGARVNDMYLSWKVYSVTRKRRQSIKPSLERIKVYARGWLDYYGIASMESNMNDVNGWFYHRIRMCIWKQWKHVRSRYRNLRGMGVPKDLAWKAANSRRGYWFTTHTVAITWQ